MIALSIALVVIAALGLWGFRMWLWKEYPAIPPNADHFSRRLATVEERLTTLELQRGITRKVQGT